MTDEEKKAYDNLIMLQYFTMEKEDKQAIETILNLIEKQSKEIEELKDTNKKLYEMGKQNAIQELINNDYVSKDKIKVEIEELKNMKVDGEVFTTAVNFAIKELQSLLEKE